MAEKGRLPNWTAIALAAILANGVARGADCNVNGVDDSKDISDLRFHLDPVETFTMWFGAKSRSNAIDVAIADFNGDGINELAAASNMESLVILYHQAGDHVLEGREEYGVGSSPWQLKMGDFNKDGIQDLVTRDGNESLTFLLSDGIGGFVTKTLQAIKALWSIDVGGDLDGDGSADVVAGVQGEPSVIVFLSAGTGTPQQMIYSLNGYPNAVTCGDFDRDGDLDIAAGCDGPSISVLNNDGAGRFGAPVNSDWPEYAIKMAPGDVDLDGDLDLVLVEDQSDWQSWMVSVARNDGNGRFTLGASMGAPAKDLKTIAVSDIDGDGWVDLVSSSESSMGIYIGLNDGTGDFQDPLRMGAGGMAWQVAVGDLDKDGHPDIATANGYTNNVGIFWSTPRPVSADVDGNGVPDECQPDCNWNQIPDVRDIASGTSKDCDRNGVPDECEMRSSLAIGPAEIYAAGELPESVVLADLNGDGRPDMAATDFKDMGVSVFLNRGDGTFGPQEFYTVEYGSTFVTAAALFDTKMDLVVANQSHNWISILRNLGGGNFTEKLPRISVGTYPVYILAADGNMDGHQDLFVANSGSGSVSFLKSDGKGNFASTEIPADVGTGGLAAADLDGDGRLDLAATNYYGNNVSVFLGEPDGTFSPAVNYWSYGTPNSVAAADMDGDGDVDLVVANCGMSSAVDSSVRLFVNDGTGKFGNCTIAPGFNSFSVQAVDLGGNGILDLVVANHGLGAVTILRGRGDGTFPESLDIPTGAGPTFTSIADVDGDGSPDIAVSNMTSQSLAVIRNRRTPAAKADCNRDWIPDYCQSLPDENQNGIPDVCEPDCNENDVPDVTDIAGGTSRDVDGNGVPDECQPDCNGNVVPDPYEIAQGDVADCNENVIPDECDIDSGTSMDKNSNGTPDECDGGRVIPGDANGDGGLDISDPVAILSILFTGGGKTFPCGDGSTSHPANLKLVDWQPDGAMDISDAVATLSFLFLGGGPHALSIPGAKTTQCVRIVGCKDSCSR